MPHTEVPSDPTQASNAQVSNDAPGDRTYIPNIGDKWIMDEQFFDMEFEVIDAKTINGEREITVSRRQVGKDEKGTVDRKRYSNSGVYVIEDGDTRYKQPLFSWPISLKKGQGWEVPQNKENFMVYVTHEKEEIEVPAGKFIAHRIEGFGLNEGIPIKCTIWVADGLPKIKSVHRFHNSKFEIVEMLKSFTPSSAPKP